MESRNYRPPALSLKFLIAGGFGAGKTTLIERVSEIPVMTTEENLTDASVDTDDLTGVENKDTTTVAADFGRITIPIHDIGDIVMFLFGTPGQPRFWFTWDDLVEGALGSVVLADTRRLDDCFSVIDFFEQRHVTFIIAVNQFDDSYHYTCEQVRDALDLPDEVPVVLCDARDKESVKTVLVTLLSHCQHTWAAAHAREGTPL